MSMRCDNRYPHFTDEINESQRSEIKKHREIIQGLELYLAPSRCLKKIRSYNPGLELSFLSQHGSQSVQSLESNPSPATCLQENVREEILPL